MLHKAGPLTRILITGKRWAIADWLMEPELLNNVNAGTTSKDEEGVSAWTANSSARKWGQKVSWSLGHDSIRTLYTYIHCIQSLSLGRKQRDMKREKLSLAEPEKGA